MLTHHLSEALWLRIDGTVAGRSKRCDTNKRRFVEAVLLVAELHGSWDLLPQAYGNVHTVYVRFVRWVQRNAWADILRVLEGTPNAEHLMQLIQTYRDNACRRESISTLRCLAREMKAKYGRQPISG